MNHNKKNIFIEGLQGSGKSTLANKLAKELPDYHFYQEGGISPVELAWCGYLNEKQYKEVLSKYPDIAEDIKRYTKVEEDRYIVAYTRILTDYEGFHNHLGSYEIYDGQVDFPFFRDTIMKRYELFSSYGNLFECSFFQNSIECMMLFYEMPEDEIVGFYKQAYEILRDKNFRMIYIDSSDIAGNIAQIRKERADTRGNEIWFSLMMEYLTKSPYGKRHGYQNGEDLIKHLECRRRIELRVIDEVIGEKCLVVKSKEFEMGDVVDIMHS
ncbi:P-loop NTPase family protein [[Clostridium] polysaccharolyticum]|uniref:Thymidylate kinase n=1 Tax=[Clostridium] polysaccharolyticum TaxID=29364 RepID=A0A1H9Y075_9FIRM|nr:hypothetical protein [[Clostridium] polysaccharolyticum]SES61998.1 hypothetical protein SAMN04487772_10118 [[Clostridium] polysaccharolyticum]